MHSFVDSLPVLRGDRTHNTGVWCDAVTDRLPGQGFRAHRDLTSVFTVGAAGRPRNRPQPRTDGPRAPAARSPDTIFHERDPELLRKPADAGRRSTTRTRPETSHHTGQRGREDQAPGEGRGAELEAPGCPVSRTRTLGRRATPQGSAGHGRCRASGLPLTPGTNGEGAGTGRGPAPVSLSGRASR